MMPVAKIESFAATDHEASACSLFELIAAVDVSIAMKRREAQAVKPGLLAT
jgi:hypothetical protein